MLPLLYSALGLIVLSMAALHLEMRHWKPSALMYVSWHGSTGMWRVYGAAIEYRRYVGIAFHRETEIRHHVFVSFTMGDDVMRERDTKVPVPFWLCTQIVRRCRTRDVKLLTPHEARQRLSERAS